MAKVVKLRSGSHRHVDNERYQPGAILTVSDAVYNAFAFKFELLEDLNARPDPEPEPVPERAMPSNATQGALDMIAEFEVDWANIVGSGRDGRILQKDVEDYINRGDA